MNKNFVFYKYKMVKAKPYSKEYNNIKNKYQHKNNINRFDLCYFCDNKKTRSRSCILSSDFEKYKFINDANDGHCFFCDKSVCDQHGKFLVEESCMRVHQKLICDDCVLKKNMDEITKYNHSSKNYGKFIANFLRKKYNFQPIGCLIK